MIRSVEFKIQNPAIPKDALVFARGENIMIGTGKKREFLASGENRFQQLSQQFSEFIDGHEIQNSLPQSNAGPVGFVSIAFGADSTQASTLVVCEKTLVIRDGFSWLTLIDSDDASWDYDTEAIDQRLSFSEGSQTAEAFKEAVSTAVSKIQNGELSKVVLARDLVAKLPTGFDIRPALDRLRKRYPSCWVYNIAGQFGASPELLIRASHSVVSARVLAGTAGRGTDPDVDRAIAEGLSHSTKNLHEHAFAVDSLTRALEPYCSSIEADKTPFSLALPDVWHLATDVHAKLKSSVGILDVAASLHPTAAVAGTPRDIAQQTISELELFDRGGYAGPVGWVSADGDGELAIALRGGHIKSDTLTAFAGCGIVSESDPDAELSETELKFRAIRSVLG